MILKIKNAIYNVRQIIKDDGDIIILSDAEKFSISEDELTNVIDSSHIKRYELFMNIHIGYVINQKGLVGKITKITHISTIDEVDYDDLKKEFPSEFSITIEGDNFIYVVDFYELETMLHDN